MLEPVVADAFHRGDVDALKARQVASFCQHPPKNMTPADVDKARGILLGLASKNIADCDAVRAAIRRIETQYGKREDGVPVGEARSEEHTSELQSLMRISYAGFGLKKKNKNKEP